LLVELLELGRVEQPHGERQLAANHVMTDPAPDVGLVEIEAADKIEVELVERRAERGRQRERVRAHLAPVEELLLAPQKRERIVDLLLRRTVLALALVFGLGPLVSRRRDLMLDEQERAGIAVNNIERDVLAAALGDALGVVAQRLRPDQEVADVFRT